MPRSDADIQEVIEQHLRDATDSLEKAARLADAHDLTFDWYGPAGEMNFSYSKLIPWESSGSCEWEESSGEDEGGWVHNW